MQRRIRLTPGQRSSLGLLHGLTVLKLNGRLPSDDITEPVWQIGIQQFRLTPYESRGNGSSWPPSVTAVEARPTCVIRLLTRPPQGDRPGLGSGQIFRAGQPNNHRAVMIISAMKIAKG
jgi:hypothetical protein